MSFISKIMFVKEYPLHKIAIIAMRSNARLLSNTCDSGDKKDSSTPEDGSGKQPSTWNCNPCDCNPSIPTVYESRKYGHCLASNDMMPPFEPIQNIPTGIFRCTTGEKLGPGARKCSCYQCPEYFSYQHMTYYDMHLSLRGCRSPCPKTGRKP